MVLLEMTFSQYAPDPWVLVYENTGEFMNGKGFKKSSSQNIKSISKSISKKVILWVFLDVEQQNYYK